MSPSGVKQDVAADLSRYVVRTKFDDLPGGVVLTAKQYILDSLGNAFAGSTAPGASQARDVEVHWRGLPESTVFAFGDKLPAPQAAFLNGMLIHARDFDDTHDIAIVHANASVLPAAFAVAEQATRISGKELITAIVLGVDLVCRLGLSLRYYRGWHNSAICGGFGAAAAAAKILGLDEQGTANALGIAYAQTAGNIQCIRDGALTKRMQLGFAARNGVLAATYARAGLTGSTHTFDGPYGFFHLYDGDVVGEHEVRHRPQGHYGQHELTDQLGKRFEISNLSMKPYPNCRAIHPAIAGVLATCQNGAIDDIAQIERVQIKVSQRTFERTGAILDFNSPVLQVNAQFSMAYGVAVAICRGKVVLQDFNETAIRDEAVADMMRKVNLQVEPSYHENLPVGIEIILRNGQRHATFVQSLPGSPEHPLDDDEVAAKFEQCCQLSVVPLSTEKIKAMVHAVNHLESMRDIRELTELLH